MTQESSHCVTILYPAGAGLTFNADYYRDHHLPLIMRLYGDSIARFELRTVDPTPAGAPAPAYAAAINIWIRDFDAFQQHNETHGPALIADVANFTNTMPTIQFDRVQGEDGTDRGAMQLGDTCLTILYPNGASVRWDVDYYRRAHMPLIMRLYGAAAIKRFELRRGESGAPTGAPPYIGCVNIYINDHQAFGAAGVAHGQTLIDDVPAFSSVMPTAFATTIHGIGGA
jgi:uncharacterized protein (TIGR02118 family)